MFEEIMRASQAAAAHRLLDAEPSRPLAPALWSCEPCATAGMIASPVWSACPGCGGQLSPRAAAVPAPGPARRGSP